MIFSSMPLECNLIGMRVDEAMEEMGSYVDEANEMLRKCRLWEVYPVNPYESFLMMCLLTEDPLCAFNDVWENSYGK